MEWICRLPPYYKLSNTKMFPNLSRGSESGEATLRGPRKAAFGQRTSKPFTIFSLTANRLQIQETTKKWIQRFWKVLTLLEKYMPCLIPIFQDLVRSRPQASIDRWDRRSTKWPYIGSGSGVPGAEEDTQFTSNGCHGKIKHVEGPDTGILRTEMKPRQPTMLMWATWVIHILAPMRLTRH